MRLLAGIHSSLEKKLDAETLRRLEARELFMEQDRELAERRHGQIAAGHKPVLAIYTDGGGIHKRLGSIGGGRSAIFWK